MGSSYSNEQIATDIAECKLSAECCENIEQVTARVREAFRPVAPSAMVDAKET